MHTLSIEDQKLALAIGFPKQIMQFIRNATNAPFLQLERVTDDFDKELTSGILMEVRFDEAEQLLPELRTTLTEHGYQVFFYGQTKSEDFVEIGILKSMDPYDILRIKQTNGLNYDLDTEDIIATLTSWQDIASFTILFASFNSVELLFHELPEDVEAFLEDEVRPFCFDFGTQAMLGEDSIIDDFKKYKKLSLWWD